MAVIAKEKCVSPIHKLINLVAIVEQKSRFKVAFVDALATESGAGQVSGTDEGQFTVDYQRFGVHPGAKHAFEKFRAVQSGITVELFSKTRTGLFCMNEADRDTALYQLFEQCQQRLKAAVELDIQVFDIRGYHPEEALCLRDVLLQHFCVDISVEYQTVHLSGNSGRDTGIMHHRRVSVGRDVFPILPEPDGVDMPNGANGVMFGIMNTLFFATTLPRVHRIGLVFAIVLLAGCGFAPRGSISVKTDIGAVFVDAQRDVPIASLLKQQLVDQDMQLATSRERADILLRLDGEMQSQRILSVQSTGRVSEYELAHSVRMLVVQGENGQPPAYRSGQRPNLVSVRREYTYDDTGVLGKEDEATILRNEMREELARNLLLRMAASLQ